MNLLELFWSLQNNANHFGHQIKPLHFLKHSFFGLLVLKVLKSPEVNHFYFYVRS
jgi:hypothetical protein